MVFSSYEFIFLFVPVTVAGYFLIARLGRRLAAAWLVAASLFFYGWWNPVYVPLLLASISFNYLVGMALARRVGGRLVLFLGVAANLALLGYFKYADFFIASLAAGLGADHGALGIVLPLGISFFTFTQIAFLVDAHRGTVREYDPIHYGLFVTFFPHLIAGPIYHHKEIIPQFARDSVYRPALDHIAVGASIFAIGLFKKLVLADSIGIFATKTFTAVAGGAEPALLEAWGGALAYSLQLYFDFSGYSDMAIGAARLIGVRLPLNFHSPYKAASIIEFWRRWHMTLSRFLREYLYFALGGSHKGPARRYVNLMIVMLLGGLWHGAGWSFVLWGGLHGLFLIVNHGWRALVGQGGGRTWHLASVAITFLCVVVAWVPFRAEDLGVTLAFYQGMVGLNGISLPAPIALGLGLGPFREALAGWGFAFPLDGARDMAYIYGLILALLPIVWLLPNSQELMRRYRPALLHSGFAFSRTAILGRLVWRPTVGWAAATAAIAAFGVISLSRYSEFIYFQF